MNNTVNLLRILAAFGVVWFHAKQHHGLYAPHFGSAVFAAILGYYACKSRTVRVEALVVAFVFWGVLYAFMAYVVVGKPVPRIDQLIISPVIHLWFLPFAVVVKYFAKFSETQRPWFFVLAIIATVCLRGLDIPAPYVQWVYAAPYALAGMLFFRYPIRFDPVKFDTHYLSGLMFGVYLIHPAIMFIAIRTVEGASIPIFTFTVSVLCMHLYRQAQDFGILTNATGQTK